MNVDSVITLDNNKNYLLLDRAEYQGKAYYTAALLDDDDEPTNDYVVFEETIEDDEIYAKEVTDPEVLSVLVDIFANSLKKGIEKLEEI